MKFLGIIALALVCSFGFSQSKGQTIAIIDKNDSLIIRKDLETVVVSEDQVDGLQNAEGHYSENLDEVLDRQNGISLTKRGNYASEVVHRGMASERMSTTINGMKIFSACTDKMDPVTSYVATNNLESFDLHSTEESKCFGSNTGGLLNMNTKEAVLNDSRKMRSLVSLGFNSVSIGQQASFSTNYSEKNWALRLNGMYADHENYKAGGGEEIPYSQYSKANFGASLKTKLGPSDFLLVDYIRDDAWDVGYPALPMDVGRATADIYSLTYRRYFKGKWSGKANVKLYGNNISHDMDDSQRDVVMHMDMPGLSTTYGSFVNFDFNEVNAHKLSVTADVYQNRSFAEMTMFPEGEKEMYMLTWPDVYRTLLGLYVSDRYTFKNKNHVSLSARIDVGNSDVRSEFGKKQLQVFGYHVDQAIHQRAANVSLGYTIEMKNERSLVFSTSYAERLPSVSEQFAFYIFNAQDGYDYIGDPFIENESNYSVEINHRKTKKNLSWGAGVFLYHMPNYIFGQVDPELSAMTIGAAGVKRYINLDHANMTGIEADINWRVFAWLNMKSLLSYNYGFDNEGRPLQLMSPLKNNTSFTASCKKNRFNLALISATRQNRFNEDAGENSTPSYAILNLNYQRKMSFKEKSLIAMVGIDNVFDSNYRDHLDWVDVPRPGRNLFIKLNFEF